MSLTQTAILASALKSQGSSPKSQPSNISESVAQKPLQWLVVAGVVGYTLYKVVGGAVNTSAERAATSAQTTTSASNPWSFSAFLAQRIPAGTKLMTSAGAYAQAKKVYDALNTYFSDDADIVVGVFSALPSQVQVAQVAQSFSTYYKRDILDYIKNGKKTFDFGSGGISTEQYNIIIANVSKKPKF